MSGLAWLVAKLVERRKKGPRLDARTLRHIITTVESMEDFNGLVHRGDLLKGLRAALEDAR